MNKRKMYKRKNSPPNNGLVKNKLVPTYLMKIKEVFDNQHWEKEEKEKNSLFSRFCIRTSDLPDDDSRDLFLELADRFLWVPDDKYLDLMMKCIKKLFDENPDLRSKEHIYIYQLISPEDEKKRKIKSSARMLYSFNDAKIIQDRQLSQYKVTIRDKIDENEIEKVNQSNSALLLVDDFVGSGDTAVKSVNNLTKLGVNKTNIYVFALVAQNIGVDKLKNNNIRIAVAEQRKKGITDYYGSKSSEKIKIMEKAERKLKVKKEFSLGYNGTEALVSMIKTPNNTFPVFWMEPTKDKKAPFPRGWCK